MEKFREVSRDFEKFRLISRSLDWFQEVLSFDQHWILHFSILHMLFSDKSYRLDVVTIVAIFLIMGVSHCAPKYTYICSFIYQLSIILTHISHSKNLFWSFLLFVFQGVSFLENWCDFSWNPFSNSWLWSTLTLDMDYFA